MTRSGPKENLASSADFPTHPDRISPPLAYHHDNAEAAQLGELQGSGPACYRNGQAAGICLLMVVWWRLRPKRAGCLGPALHQA